MLPRIVTEYRELFDAFIAPQLHPRDVVALGSACACARALCSHCMHVHATTFAHTLTSIRAIEYRIVPRIYYATRDTKYVIVHSAQNLRNVSVRDGITYMYKAGLADYGLVAMHICNSQIYRHVLDEDTYRMDVYANWKRNADTIAWRMRRIAITCMMDRFYERLRPYLSVYDRRSLARASRQIRTHIGNFERYLWTGYMRA